MRLMFWRRKKGKNPHNPDLAAAKARLAEIERRLKALKVASQVMERNGNDR